MERKTIHFIVLLLMPYLLLAAEELFPYAVITEPHIAGGFGWSVAAGDFDGDGIRDVAIGAPMADIVGTSNGAIYIYTHGDFSSPSLSIFGIVPGGQLAISLDCAGDFNGDGYDDILAGANVVDHTGAAYIFFAYIGFDAVSTTAQEAKNPQRDLPIGIIASLAICTVLYILVAAVLTGMVPWREVNIEAPLARAFMDRGLSTASHLITMGALAGLTSVMLVMLLGQTRVLYAMANDGLLPRKFFAAIHPKFRTPYKNTILVGLAAAFVGSLTPIEDLGKMVNIGTLMAFVIVCFAVIVLRVTNPDQPRPFRTPLVPLIPILGILFNGYMMYKLGYVNWLRLILWLIIGLFVYFSYSRKHSRIR